MEDTDLIKIRRKAYKPKQVRLFKDQEKRVELIAEREGCNQVDVVTSGVDLFIERYEREHGPLLAVPA